MNSALLTVAAGGALVDIDGTLFIQMGIFFFMFIFLYFALFRPVIRMVEARREATEGTSSKAAKMNEEAATLAADIDEQLRDARSSVADERDRMLDQARNKEREVLAAASEVARKQMLDSRSEMVEGAGMVRRLLKKDVDALADAVASQVLGRQV